MARLPEIRAKEVIQNTGIIQPADRGGALLQLGRDLGAVGATIGEAEKRERVAAERAYMASVEVDNRERLAQIYASSGDDPEKFRAAATGHIKGVVESVPEHLRAKIEPSLRSTATGLYAGSLNTQVQRLRTVQQDALIANQNHYANVWMNLTDQGLGGTQQAADAMNKYIESGDGLVKNNFRSQEHVAAMLADKQNEALGRTILSSNRQTYQQFGFGAAWQELNDTLGEKSVVANPKIRSALLNQGQEFLREQTAALARVDAESEKAIKKSEEETGKLMIELSGKGQLSMEWLLQNKRNLSKSDFSHGMTALTKADAAQDDLAVFDELDRRASKEDVTSEVVAAQKAGLLKSETARSLIRRNRDTLAKAGPKGAFDIAEDNLKESFAVSALVSDPAARQRKANALEMFRLGVAEENKRREAEGKPLMNDREIFDLRDEVKTRFQFISFEETVIGLPLPRFFVGTRNNPNLDATEQAIAQAYRSGQLTPEQAEKEAGYLKQWRDAVAKRPTTERKKK